MLTVVLITRQFDNLTRMQIEHEGILLSNALEPKIKSLCADGKLVEVQQYIDHFVALREKNDIEVNIILLDPDLPSGSSVVASNILDNIEETDGEEHQELLMSLKRRAPHIVVDREDEELDPGEEALLNDPSHPDHYLGPGFRFVSISTPLSSDGVELGSMNLKMSLRFLDESLQKVRRIVFLIMTASLILLLAIIGILLQKSMFVPLAEIAQKMSLFGAGHLNENLPSSARRDEIGVLQNQFGNMVVGIRTAEEMKEALERMQYEEERKRLEDQLQQAQKMEAMGTLAGGIAHDFNNILVPILGYCELALNKTPVGHAIHPFLEKMLSGATRAQELVKQILTFSRRQNEHVSPIQLSPIIKEAVKLIRASLPSSIELHTEITTESCRVLANPTQIHQCIMNLCTNAYHAMKRTGGSILVSLKPTNGPKHVDSNGSDWVCIEVKDTGCGMPPEVLEQIFNPYFTTKEEGEGTGLGLAVVHGIVKGMQGHLSVESQVNEGTTFSLFLPMTEEAVALDQTQSAMEIPSGNESILVVDDEDEVVDLIQDILSDLGYRVHTETDSKTAFTYLEKNHAQIDLMITDLTMPNLSGTQLAYHAKALSPRLKVILCSGYADVLSLEMAKSVGIFKVLTKPVPRRELAFSVRHALDMPS